jgi:hypothetical protein
MDARAPTRWYPHQRDRYDAGPKCFGEMAPCDIRLKIQGHGSAVAPGVMVHFESPGLKSLHVVVGVQGLEVSRGAIHVPHVRPLGFLRLDDQGPRTTEMTGRLNLRR